MKYYLHSGKVQDEKDVKFLRKFVFVMVALLVGTILIITGMTSAVVFLSKDTTTSSDDNALRVKSSGLMVATDKPRTYIMLTDLPLLPSIALDNLNSISFTRSDGISQKRTISGI